MDCSEKPVTERERRFQVLERIRARLPERPEAEVTEDVAQAIAVVRQERAAGGGKTSASMNREHFQIRAT